MSLAGEMIQPTISGDESPFLPGTKIQYAWDATCLGYFKRCPRLYYYKIIEGWNPKEDRVHIRFGSEFHKALEEYDRFKAEGMKHKEAEREAVRHMLERTKDWESDHIYKNRMNLLRTVVYYLDDYKDDLAKTIKLPNGKLAVELSFRFPLDWGPNQGMLYPVSMDGLTKTDGDPNKEFQSQPYLLCGHLDRVVEYMGTNFVMDRKTTKGTLGRYYFAQYDLDNQMSLYTLAGQVLFEAPIRGVIIDAAQVLVDDSVFGRGITYRTPSQIDEWVDGLRYWFALQEQFAIADKWPMNDTACDKFGGCEFREICRRDPKVRERFLASSFNREEPWNPLKVR
jgi:PD-(D/E)XK nuclease superfamily